MSEKKPDSILVFDNQGEYTPESMERLLASHAFGGNRSRPYDGQPWTAAGKRGAILIQGLTMRDVGDCIARGAVLSNEGVRDAAISNALCEIEKMMGIFPAVPDGPVVIPMLVLPERLEFDPEAPPENVTSSSRYVEGWNDAIDQIDVTSPQFESGEMLHIDDLFAGRFGVFIASRNPDNWQARGPQRDTVADAESDRDAANEGLQRTRRPQPRESSPQLRAQIDALQARMAEIVAALGVENDEQGSILRTIAALRAVPTPPWVCPTCKDPNCG